MNFIGFWAQLTPTEDRNEQKARTPLLLRAPAGGD